MLRFQSCRIVEAISSIKPRWGGLVLGALLLGSQVAFATFLTLPKGVSGDDALVAALGKISERVPPAPGDWWYQRYHFHYDADVVQDLKTGRILVDLSHIKRQVLPELAKIGIHPDEMLLEINGGKVFGGEDIPVDMSVLRLERPYAIFQGGPVNRQQYIRVALKEKGRFVHVLDNSLLEKIGFPRIDPQAYASYPEASLQLPDYFDRRFGMDTGLVRLSGVIQHRHVVWSVSKESKNTALKNAFDLYGPDLDPVPIADRRGERTGWKILVPGGHVIRAGLDDLQIKGGAAFNQHSFFWDDHYLAEARANSDPRIAIDTLVYWLEAQQPDGSIGRELDYKGQPFQRPLDVKFGKASPNLEFFNPPIEGWAWHEVLRWSPGTSARYLPRVLEMIRKHRKWLLQDAGVYGEDGKLIGFLWSNHGSGRDNSPRPIDEQGLDAFPKYSEKSDAAAGRSERGLAVDLLAQYKMMIDSERELCEILGRFDEAAKAASESKEIADLLNRRYFNPGIGWYVDVVPSGEKDWKPSSVVTLAGFWPVAAKAASPDRVATMIRDYLENPGRFGGPFLPSVPRDNPYYDEGGHYWRGGGWPSDWEMVMRAVYEYGFRAEAAELAGRHMGAMTVASEGYAIGDTPEFMVKWVDAKPSAGTMADYQRVHDRIDEYFHQFWGGQIHNPDAPGVGTVFEFYGLRPDGQNYPVPTYGQEIIEDGDDSLHTTRSDFGGWGVVVPLRSVHYLMGFDAVPRFQGKESELGEWLHALLSDPDLAYQNVGGIPAFKPLADFVAANPDASPAEFEAELKRVKGPKLDAQLKLLRRGYVEVAPAFDPVSGTALQNYFYDGQRFDLRIDREANGDIRLELKSPKKLLLRFDRRWGGAGYDSHASDVALDSSPIFAIGGDTPVVVLRNGRIVTR